MREIIYDSDWMDMELGFAYRFLNQYSTLMSAHLHNFYEYFLVTSGHVIHHVNGRKEKLSRGDLVLIRPNDYHSYELCGNEEFTMINIAFCTHHFLAACQYLGRDLERQLLELVQPPSINVLPFADCSLEKDHDFLKFFVGDNDELVMRLRFLLSETLLIFSRYFRLERGPTYDAWLHRTLAQMSSQENIEEGIPALLRITGISHGHLCRLMKQQLNMTPNQYITRLRLTYAANMLASSNNSILDISLKCGYSSVSHFITTFKKHYGVAPHTYRQEYSKSANWK